MISESVERFWERTARRGVPRASGLQRRLAVSSELSTIDCELSTRLPGWVEEFARLVARQASLRRIDMRAFLSDRAGVTGAELFRKLQRLGRRRGVRVVFRAERGKGSHGTLYYGDRFTTLKDRHKELSPSLLSAMLKQLGLSRQDIHGAAKSMGGQ